jgi:signal peptidase I
MTAQRKPWLAALLTLIQPGLGHLYAGSLRGAVLWWLAVFAGVIITPVLAVRFPVGVAAAIASWTIPTGLVTGAIISAVQAGRRAPSPYPQARFNRWYVYVAVWLSSLALHQFVLRPFLRRSYEAFRIPSASMEPTILVGDFLYIRKPLSAPVHRGAVVVFTSVEETGLKVIKRIVGIPGDTLAMRHGEFSVNGVPPAEPYLPPHAPTRRSESPDFRDKMRRWQLPHLVGAPASYRPDLDDWGPLVIPPDSVFVLGDNREASYDSRYWGLVATHRILGEPALVYYSYDPRSLSALRWLTAIRWSRIGQRFTD